MHCRVSILSAALVGCALASTDAPTRAPAVAAVVATPRRLQSSEPCALPGTDAELAALLVPHDESKAGHSHGHPKGPDAGGPAPGAELLAEVQRLRATIDGGRCRRIRYSSDDLSIVGYILEPEHAESGRQPAVLVARGGNRDLGKVGPMLLLELQALVDAGFVVIATQYRGADGSDGVDEFGGADLADLQHLVPLAAEITSVDRDNLFLLGYSRGGMMAAMALREGMPVRAAAMFSGSFDLAAGLDERPEMLENYRALIPGFATDPDAALRRRSAVHWGAEITTPTLLLAGRQDWRTPFEANAARLAKVMQAAGREVELVAYDDGHSLGQHRREAYREIVRWFEAHRGASG